MRHWISSSDAVSAAGPEGSRTSLPAPRSRLGDVLAEPALRLRDRDALPCRVVLELVATDATDHEVPRLGVLKVQTRHRGRRQHGARLGEVHADVARADQLEERLAARV